MFDRGLPQKTCGCRWRRQAYVYARRSSTPPCFLIFRFQAKEQRPRPSCPRNLASDFREAAIELVLVAISVLFHLHDMRLVIPFPYKARTRRNGSQPYFVGVLALKSTG